VLLVECVTWITVGGLSGVDTITVDTACPLITVTVCVDMVTYSVSSSSNQTVP
jgi:hypothetical protein